MCKKCCINAPNVFCHIDRMEIMLYTCIMNKGNEEMNKSISNPAKSKDQKIRAMAPMMTLLPCFLL